MNDKKDDPRKPKNKRAREMALFIESLRPEGEGKTAYLTRIYPGSISTHFRWKDGKCEPSNSVVIYIAEKLGISQFELYGCGLKDSQVIDLVECEKDVFSHERETELSVTDERILAMNAGDSVPDAYAANLVSLMDWRYWLRRAWELYIETKKPGTRSTLRGFSQMIEISPGEIKFFLGKPDPDQYITAPRMKKVAVKTGLSPIQSAWLSTGDTPPPDGFFDELKSKKNIKNDDSNEEKGQFGQNAGSCWIYNVGEEFMCDDIDLDCSSLVTIANDPLYRGAALR